MGVCLSQARHGCQPDRADNGTTKASRYKWTNQNFFSISEQQGACGEQVYVAAVARSVLNDRVNVINYSSPKVLGAQSTQSPLTAPNKTDFVANCIHSVSHYFLHLNQHQSALAHTSQHFTSLSSLMQQCSALINSHSYNKCCHKNQCDHSPFGILHAFCKT